jgi:subtilisin family serine protease
MTNASRLIALLLLGLALPASTASSAAGQSRPSGLCGIVYPLDALLHCADRPAPPTPPSRSDRTLATTATHEAATEPGRPAALQTLAAHTVSPLPRYAPNLLMVRFKPSLPVWGRAQLLKEAGVVIDHQIGQLGVFVVRMPPNRRDRALALLRASPSVAGAEKDALVEKLDTTPNDTNWSQQWGLQRIGLPSIWDQTRGASVVVAVLDTGIDGSHPDLQGAVLPGFDLTGSRAGASDVEGHGTSVAGIIAARTNNHQGVAGICWTCPILPVKVLGDDGQGTMDALAEGIVKATDGGVRVINMSLGGPAGSDTLDQAISYARAKDVILVAAAGNNGTSTPYYPAANPSVVSVAATDEADELYPWSDFGSWVRVAAPGCNPAPVPGGSYAIFCGTSSATPVVSGLIALALSLRPDLTRDQIVRALTTGTVPLAALPQGRIDGPAALAVVAPGKVLAPAGPRLATSTFHGSLAPTRTWRVHQRVVQAGLATGLVTFTRGAWLTLSLISSSNKVLATISGRTPLRLTRRLDSGLYWFGVATAPPTRASYTLRVTAPT